MANYSINDLEKITGVKAHTIRIWEKRYDIVHPSRTDTNIRYYCDEDLKRLMNISVLLKHGYKISKLARLDQNEISNRIKEIAFLNNNGHTCHIDNLVISMIDLDEVKFDKTLSSLIIKEGFEKAVFEVIYPFFDKIGILWQTGTINPAQEHFISNLLKQKIYTAIDGVAPETNEHSKKFVLFLPEWEMHELGLLFYNYMLKVRGHKVIYLGQNVPYPDVQQVYDLHKPDYLFTSFSFAVDDEKFRNYIGRLSNDFADIKIFITGLQVAHLDKLPSNMIRLDSALQFRDQYLAKI